jgi:phosphoadenosine phosphosulfate reductase
MSTQMLPREEGARAAERLSSDDVTRLNERFAGASAGAALAHAAAHFGSRLAVACSLGVEDVVVLDLLAKLPDSIRGVPRVFVLDTGRLPEETYDLLERVRARYPGRVELYLPDAVRVEQLVRTKGPLSFRRSIEDRRECCAIRKLGPLSRALAGADAWVTGLRRVQSTSRAETGLFELDAGNDGRLKVSPLVDWTDDQVWNYVKANDVPYNALHDAGYPSIGCAPCTRAVAPGEDSRSGRWWWETPEEGRECGLHSTRRPKR